MPVVSVRCSACGEEFIDSRKEIAEGDEAMCPKCGARNEFTRGFAAAVQRGIVETNVDAPVAHSEQEIKSRS